jgi:hypothetical protein
VSAPKAAFVATQRVQTIRFQCESTVQWQISEDAKLLSGKHARVCAHPNQTKTFIFAPMTGTSKSTKTDTVGTLKQACPRAGGPDLPPVAAHWLSRGSIHRMTAAIFVPSTVLAPPHFGA